MFLNVGGMMDYGFGGGWMLFGSISMILFWVVVVLLIIWLYRQITGGEAATKGEGALEDTEKKICRRRDFKGGV